QTKQKKRTYLTEKRTNRSPKSGQIGQKLTSHPLYDPLPNRDPSTTRHQQPHGGDCGVFAKSLDEAEFQEFWSVFPRKDGRREALAAWEELTAGERQLAKKDLPRRMNANWAGRDVSKIPQAARYLNEHRWED